MQLALMTLLRPLLPDHLYDRTPDPASPHRRRFTAKYRRKLGLVKNLWIAAGLLVLLSPTVATLLIVGLSMTFLAFIVLDETP